ncbi:MAG TPA: hypothetical protein VGI12_11440 [Vicinamibacterales bacterium]
MQVSTVVGAEGAVLDRVLDATYPASSLGLSREAFATLDAALGKTPWARGHQRRYALIRGADILASAQRCDLCGTLGEQALRICGIGALWSDPAHGDAVHARVLVERLVDDARRDGADLAVVCASPASTMPMLDGFAVVPTHDVELNVAESSRYGAPMTLVRGGEDRDLAAIVAMGQARASRYRFHLERDADLVKYAITKKRLLAGLGISGVRQLLFVIAEEGITAAAYAVISIVNGSWTIEECGDRDTSGARVGAILQALIAREPVERRPVIRGWLPPGFVPPQVTIVSTQPAAEILFARPLTVALDRLALFSDDVLYWRSDFL